MLTQEQLEQIRAQYFFPGPCPVCGEKRTQYDEDPSFYGCISAYAKLMAIPLYAPEDSEISTHFGKSFIQCTPDRRIIHLVKEYEALVKEKRERALTELTQMSQEMGLYDEI